MSDLFEVSNDMIEIAREFGLDPFDVRWEVVPNEYMLELATYGMPNRASHWSYGRTYSKQKIMGEMGFSHLYEIVFNNDPAYAYLLNTNTITDNALVVAHVYAHSDFFKHNMMFKDTDRNMINHATSHAVKFEKLRSQHGDDAVDRVMDVAFALEGHLDWRRGCFRKKYPAATTKFVPNAHNEFDDLFFDTRDSASLKQVKMNGSFPPHKEKDILWFLSNYSKHLEEWERDIFDAIREEAYYFFPQRMTKIMNEGWASYWHAEIMNEYHTRGLLSDENYINFCKVNAGVVSQPPGQINPYYLGFRIWKDIKDRWDRYNATGFEEENGDKVVDKNGAPILSKINGSEKLFEVRKYEDDISFIQNYLTKDLIQDMGLFRWGYACDCGSGCAKCSTIIITSLEADKIKDDLVKPIINGGYPIINIVSVDSDGSLLMEHQDHDRGTLEHQYAEGVLEYIYEVWGRPVVIRTQDEGQVIDLCSDREGFRVYDSQ